MKPIVVIICILMINFTAFAGQVSYELNLEYDKPTNYTSCVGRAMSEAFLLELHRLMRVQNLSVQEAHEKLEVRMSNGEFKGCYVTNAILELTPSADEDVVDIVEERGVSEWPGPYPIYMVDSELISPDRRLRFTADTFGAKIYTLMASDVVKKHNS